jgi:hypothetical protein
MRGFYRRNHNEKVITEKCTKCGEVHQKSICPGCGKELTFRNAKLNISLWDSKRRFHIRVHSRRCLKKALGNEAHDAVVTLLNGKGSQAQPSLRGRTPAVLRRIIKRAEKTKARAMKDLKKAEKK